MTDRDLLAEARGLPVTAPDDHSVTRFHPYVLMRADVRDALVEVADAAQGHTERLVRAKPEFRDPDDPLDRLYAAVARLGSPAEETSG